MRVRPANYTTRQGTAILAYLETLGDAYATASQVAEHFADGEERIGRTTVFRQLDRLVKEGSIRKFLTEGQTGACYQFVEKCELSGEHYHLKCETCGKLIHGDKPLAPPPEILQNYGFAVDEAKAVFYGKCRDCVGVAHNERES